MDYPNLFSGIDLGKKSLRNRIVFPAAVGNYAQQHRVTDRMIDYYAARAEGGAAMIVTEGLIVDQTSVPPPTVVTLYEQDHFDGLQRLAAAVEAHDCRLVGQLWHFGRQQLWNSVASPVGVSNQPDAYSWIVPHVLGIDDIARLVDSYTAAARMLQRAGFSGAELHGAHGYLITQFLSPWSNTRQDRYGGDLEGRTRFVREVMSSIRAACGSDFILGLKMPGDEGVKGGLDPDEAERILGRLRPLGQLDYIAFSQGNFGPSLEDHVPDMHYPPGPFLSIHKRLRAKADGLPVMAVGRIVSADHAEAVLADGAADLVAMARALISDAALPNKARSGNASDIRPCIFCNVCWAEVHAMKPMSCIHNPELATPGEARWQPLRAAVPRRVTVVGAGAAGLEAAWVAAARGHAVTLFGASTQAGGKARLEASLGPRSEVAKVFERQLRMATKHRVEMVLGQPADHESIVASNPDLVLVATGSRLRLPSSLRPGSESGMDLRECMATLLATPAPEVPDAGTAVVFDEDQSAVVYAVVDQLAQRFRRVVLMTPRAHYARPVAYVSAIGIYRRLYANRVDMLLATVPTFLGGRTLTAKNAYTGDETSFDDVALFTYATPRISSDALADSLRSAGIEARLIGDALSPRTMMAAVHEGNHAGRDA